MTTTTKSIPDICREAADLIESRGLANGTRKDHLGRLCLIGAFGQVEHGDPMTGDYGVVNVVAERLVSLGYMENDSWLVQAVADWSNRQAGQEHPEVVVSTLREVADNIEQDAA